MNRPSDILDGEAGGSLMDDEDDPAGEISRIEAQLEELAEVSDRCRKFILASKAAIAGGGALLLLMILGLFGSSPVAAIGSIAMVLGGVVRSARISARCDRPWPTLTTPRLSVRSLSAGSTFASSVTRDKAHIR